MKRVLLAALAALLAFPLGVGSAIADDYEEDPAPEVSQVEEAHEAHQVDEVYQIDAIYQADDT